MKLYSWNNETKRLVPYHNATVLEYIDSDVNRGLVISDYTDDKYGQVETMTYINFTTGVLTSRSDKIGYCGYMKTNMSFSLKYWIEKATDPQADVGKYLGEQNLPWSNETFYAF